MKNRRKIKLIFKSNSNGIFFYKTKIILIVFLIVFAAASFSQCPSNGGPQTGNYGKGGDNVSNNKDFNFFEWKVFVRGSKDPNELVGSLGYDSVKWVSVKDRINYTVRFENDPKVATAPAQNVFLHLPVDPKININALQLGDIGFGKFKFTIPSASSFYSGWLDLRDSMGLFVDLTAGIDVIKNEVFWLFRSIDPATGLPPTDPLKGFLPINDTIKVDSIIGKGEGFVSFTIKPLSTDKTGDTVSEKAAIIFDIDEPIPTNSWSNKIDALAPVSKINSVSVFMDTVTLHRYGIDDANGSGIKDYAFYYSENNGPFVLYQQNIPDTTIQFVGTPGKTYCFYTIASDNTNNKENLKSSCDGSTFLPIGCAVLPIT